MNYSGAEGLEFGGGNTKVDPSVAAVLPQGSRVVATEAHGISFWASTGRIDVQLADGGSQSFFIKVASKEVGRRMLNGEYESSIAMSTLLPRLIPKPIAWGSYETIPETHFFMCEYREMTEELPEQHKFASQLAAMHQNSVSPTGKFGFHISTYMGNLPQNNEWEDTWEEFFTKSMRTALNAEVKAQGPHPEIDSLSPALFDKVIPRLLSPLEREGRAVKPSLVHGDLWYANTGVDANTGETLLFDACCFYAHNEYELGQWRPVCNRFGPDYVQAYHSYVQISPPEEDYDGRLDLYKLRFNTHVSALFPKDHNYRTQMLNDLRDIVQRYGNEETESAVKIRADLDPAHEKL